MPKFNLFRFKIEPMPSNELYARISVGFATVLVIEDDAGKAIARAKSHVSMAGYSIIESQTFPVVMKESRSDDPIIQRMQKTAKAKGIGCIYDLGKSGGTLFN